MRDLIVYLQVATMAALAVIFWRDGLTRLATAQLCYCIATVVLFAGKGA